MNYCRFRNDVIKRMANAGGATPLLPPEYQQVEYLESTGTQYINTNIQNNVQFDYYVKLCFTGYTTANDNSNYIFGVWGYDNRRFVAINITSGQLSIGYSTGFSSGGNITLNTIHEISGNLHSGSQTLHLDGVQKITMTNSGNITPVKNILFLAANSVNSIVDYSKAKVYRFTLTYNGTAILDFIPCYRKSDSKPGMYDLVTDTFFTNAGTGEFSVGNNV